MRRIRMASIAWQRGGRLLARAAVLAGLLGAPRPAGQATAYAVVLRPVAHRRAFSQFPTGFRVLPLRVALNRGQIGSHVRVLVGVGIPRSASMPHGSGAAAGAPGMWTPTGAMCMARWGHTATLLPNGQVLVTGGAGYDCQDQSSFPTVGFASAELFDPGTGTWAATGSMATARWGHTATLLPSGQVLVAGGCSGLCDLTSSAEVYDPGTGTWTATGDMATARYMHTATLFTSGPLKGRVLVAGGCSDAFCTGTTTSAEVYDPGTGTWRATDSMITARAGQTATLLPNGQILVVGGFNGHDAVTSAELYDPARGRWTTTASLTTARWGHTATLFTSGPAKGRVLVVGGCSAGNCDVTGCVAGPCAVTAGAELYDPARGRWTATGSLVMARWGHTATLLPSGQVLVAGGCIADLCAGTTSAELYDPNARTWAATGSMTAARGNHTATLLPSGQILVAGGCSTGTCNVTTSAELYTPGECPNVAIFGVRGSGEPFLTSELGMGTVPSNVADEIRRRLPASVSVLPVGIEYPAVPVNVQSGGILNMAYNQAGYKNSVSTGAEILTQMLGGEVAQCPNVKIVLIGLSQGANVLEYMLTAAPKPTPVTRRLAAILLYGDPVRQPGKSYNVGSPRARGLLANANLQPPTENDVIPSIPWHLAGVTQSYCLPHDPICDASADNLIHHLDVHSTYGQSPYVAAGASFAMAHLVPGYRDKRGIQ